MDSMDSSNGRLRAFLIIAWIFSFECCCVFMHVCECSGHSVVFQVCAGNCERLIMWRSWLSSATTSLKAQLPRRRGRKLDRKPPQRKPHERLRKEQQLCSNRKGKVTTTAERPVRFLAHGSHRVLTKKDKHTNKHECQPGVPKSCSVASGDSVV